MRVLQLIDSMEPGGAERIAVSFANALVFKIEFSALCTTRKEGLLKQSLNEKVKYIYLNKKKMIDFKAIKKLNYFIRDNSISIIHAHNTSFFLGTILKILNPNLDLIWHDHHGNRPHASRLSNLGIKFCSYFFSTIITVNKLLKTWSEKKLFVKRVFCLVNYPIINEDLVQTKLEGINGKRIVCLANLRSAKDHLNLIESFFMIRQVYSDWTLHLIGNTKDLDYYNQVKSFLIKKSLEDSVFIYGSCADVSNILSQSTIGVLASKYEGLPLALLEYGLSGLPVVVTNVGDCIDVVSDGVNGILVSPQNSAELAKGIEVLINESDKRKDFGKALKLKILNEFSEKSVVESLLEIYKQNLS